MFPVWSVVFALASLVLCACLGELEYPEVGYCPVVNPCQTPLLYNVEHRCGMDEACPQGYKCCKNGCYIHKVCVVPVNKNGDQIPPPTHAATDSIDEEENEIKEWPKLSTQFTDKETGTTLTANFSHGGGSTSEFGQSTAITNDTTASNDNYANFDNATEGVTSSLTTSNYTTVGTNEQDFTPTDVQGKLSEHTIVGFTNLANATEGLENDITSSEQDSNSTIVQETFSSSTIGEDYTSFSTLSNLLKGTSQLTGVQGAGDELTSGEQNFTSTNVQAIPFSSTIGDDYTRFSTLSNLVKATSQHNGMEGAENQLTSGEKDFTSTKVQGTPFSSTIGDDYTRFSTINIQVEDSGNELTSGEQGSTQGGVDSFGNELTSVETSTSGPEILPPTTIGDGYTQPSIFANLMKAISQHIGWEGSGDGLTSDDEDDLVDGSGEGSGMTESQSTTDVSNNPQTEFINLDGGSFTFEEVSTNRPTMSTQADSGADATHFSTFTDDEDIEGSGIHTTDDDVHFPDVVTGIGTTTVGNGSTEDWSEESSNAVTTTTDSPSETTSTSEDYVRFPDSPISPSSVGSPDGSTVEQTKPWFGFDTVRFTDEITSNPPSENSSTAGDDITFTHESTPTENNHVKFLTSQGSELEGSGDDFNDTETGEDDDEREETTLPTFVSTSSTNLTEKATPSHTFPVGPNDNVTYEEDDDDEDDDGVDEDIRNNFQGKTVRG